MCVSLAAWVEEVDGVNPLLSSERGVGDEVVNVTGISVEGDDANPRRSGQTCDDCPREVGDDVVHARLTDATRKVEDEDDVQITSAFCK